MSSRAVRKAIRRREVQKEKKEAVPKAVPDQGEEVEVEEEETVQAVAPSNPFAVVSKRT